MCEPALLYIRSILNSIRNNNQINTKTTTWLCYTRGPDELLQKITKYQKRTNSETVRIWIYCEIYDGHNVLMLTSHTSSWLDTDETHTDTPEYSTFYFFGWSAEVGGICGAGIHISSRDESS